jgi:hypothetical protein
MTTVAIPPGTVVIKEFAYQYYNMVGVEIPASVKTISGCAFQGCSNLQNLVIPDSVTKIEGCAFYKCSGLQTIIISSTVKTIRECTFHKCSSLQTMVIPTSVTKIEHSAFSYCSSLQTLVIPDSVTEIGNFVFSDCSGLQRVWNKSKCDVNNITPWVHLRGPTPPLKQLRKWTFALHWHWKHPDRITPTQARLFTTGLHCLAMPTELCQTVFSYIPRA